MCHVFFHFVDVTWFTFSSFVLKHRLFMGGGGVSFSIKALCSGRSMIRCVSASRGFSLGSSGVLGCLRGVSHQSDNDLLLKSAIFLMIAAFDDLQSQCKVSTTGPFSQRNISMRNSWALRNPATVAPPSSVPKMALCLNPPPSPCRLSPLSYLNPPDYYIIFFRPNLNSYQASHFTTWTVPLGLTETLLIHGVGMTEVWPK